MATAFSILLLLVMGISATVAMSNDNNTSKSGFRVFCVSSAAAILILLLLACTK